MKLWEHLIIIFVTVSLGMVMRHLDTMPGYSCPKYCGVDHDHFRIDNPIPTDESVKRLSEVKSGS